MKRINRIKVVLVEKGKTSKWLAGELGKDNALKFIRILNNVIQLNGEALKLKSKLYTMETIDKFLSPINDIRDKIKSSKMSEEQKEQLFPY